MRRLLILAAGALCASSAFADELVTNGDFEAGSTGWTLGGTTVVGDFSGVDVTSFGGGVFGPPTNTAWLGGVDNTDDTLVQSVNTTNGGTATLAFRIHWVNEDFPGFDFLHVFLGADEVYTQDLGNNDAVTLIGPEDHSIDVSAFMNGTAKDLKFEVTTDGSFPSSAFVDNVSLQAQVVPEPATMAVLGLGGLALLRKRRK